MPPVRPSLRRAPQLVLSSSDGSDSSSSSGTYSSDSDSEYPTIGGVARRGSFARADSSKRLFDSRTRLATPATGIVMEGWLRVRHRSERKADKTLTKPSRFAAALAGAGDMMNMKKKKWGRSSGKKNNSENAEATSSRDAPPRKNGTGLMKYRWVVLTNEELIFYKLSTTGDCVRRGHLDLAVTTIQREEHEHVRKREVLFRRLRTGKQRKRAVLPQGTAQSSSSSSSESLSSTDQFTDLADDAEPLVVDSEMSRNDVVAVGNNSNSGEPQNSGTRALNFATAGMGVAKGKFAKKAPEPSHKHCKEAFRLELFRNEESVAHVRFQNADERDAWVEAIREWSERCKFVTAQSNPSMQVHGTTASEILSIMVGSWNVGNRQPPDDLSAWIPSGAYDIYAIGVQESTYDITSAGDEAADNAARDMVLSSSAAGKSKTEVASDAAEAATLAKAAVKAAKSGKADRTGVESAAAANSTNDSSSYSAGTSKLGQVTENDVWFQLVQKHVGPGYYVVASYWLWQMKLIVLARVEHRQKISKVKRDTEATGIAHVAGNKGAVGISFDFHHSSLAFVASHFAAHQDGTLARNSNFREVCKEIKLGRSDIDITNQFDALFWMGDLNYRIDLPREDVVRHAAKQSYDRLYEADQLRKEMVAHRVFEGFLEAKPTSFAPTYRYLRGTSVYNPELGRIPAYCDRVLWRTLPGRRSAGELVTDGYLDAEHLAQFQVVDGQRVDTELVSFTDSLPIETSDHKPVTAVFRQRTIVPLYRHIPRAVFVVFKHLRGAGLHAADQNGTSDPYIVFVAPFTKRKDVVRTTIKYKTLDPDWSGEEVILTCTITDDQYLVQQHVILRLIDHDRLSADDPIGEAPISLAGSWNKWVRFKAPVLHNGGLAGTVSGLVKLRDVPT